MAIIAKPHETEEDRTSDRQATGACTPEPCESGFRASPPRTSAAEVPDSFPKEPRVSAKCDVRARSRDSAACTPDLYDDVGRSMSGAHRNPDTCDGGGRTPERFEGLGGSSRGTRCDSEGLEGGGRVGGLSISEIPTDLLQLCLARVPRKFHPRLKSVCRQWRHLADTKQLLQIRKAHDKLELWTFILENEYDYYRKYLGLRGHAYNLNRDGSSEPPPHAPYGYIMWDGDRPYVAPFPAGEPIARLCTPLRLEYGATGSDSLLYVVGGRPALNGWHTGFSKPATWEVFSRTDVYNPADNSWRQLANMPGPRYGCAAGSVKNPRTGQWQVVVAGGYGTDEAALCTADIYDPETDTWRALPNLNLLKGSCRGLLVEDKLMVKQVNGGEFLEAFDIRTERWSPVLDHGQVDMDPLNIGDMNNNRSRNFTWLEL